MPKQDARPPAQILDSIAKKSADLRVAANELAERIDKFVEYLGKTPGRVEAYAYGEHPDGIGDPQFPRELVLYFTREGKGWGLEYGTYHSGFNDDPDNPVELKRLSEAPLKFKLAAVKMFPKLLDAIERQQDNTVKEIKTTAAEFDAFFASLPPNKKEGK
jgi:hypothetical protein